MIANSIILSDVYIIHIKIFIEMIYWSAYVFFFFSLFDINNKPMITVEKEVWFCSILCNEPWNNIKKHIWIKIEPITFYFSENHMNY